MVEKGKLEVIWLVYISVCDPLYQGYGHIDTLGDIGNLALEVD